MVKQGKTSLDSFENFFEIITPENVMVVFDGCVNWFGFFSAG